MSQNINQPVRSRTMLEGIQKFPNAKAFLFDMDGLIFDTERLFMEQLAVVMLEEGYTLTREIYCETLGLGGDALENKMRFYYGPEYPFRQSGERARQRVDAIASTVGLQIKPWVKQSLIWLKEREIPCAVVSSTASKYVKGYLEKEGLLEYFQEIIGGEMVQRSKPEPDIFLLGCEKCGVKPEEAVVLEDSENGVYAAVAAGIAAICIPDLKPPSPKVRQLAAVVVEP